MEKFDSPLCQWIVLYTNYFNFKFLIFIHFTNQITLKTSVVQKLLAQYSNLAQQWDRYMFHFGLTWGITDEERMEKLL